MRLTLSALLSIALVSGPALARDHRGEPMPPPGIDLPPPPGFDGPGYDQPGYDGGYGAPTDPRWAHEQDRMRGEWMARCGRDDGHGDHVRHGEFARNGCRYPDSPPASYGYPGAYMGYAVPMMMVPVLRSKPCPQVTEEWVEEVVPVRRRMIRPRPHAVRAVHDKRVRINDKRVPMSPGKRISY